MHPMARPTIRKLPPKGPPALTAREQVLAQWRRMDYSPLEKARTNVAKPLGQVLTQVWNKQRFDQRVQESEIRHVWNQVLDPQITAHAQPVNLVRGTLFVQVDSSVWLAELVQYRRREILERLRHSFGPELIKRLSFRQG